MDALRGGAIQRVGVITGSASLADDRVSVAAPAPDGEGDQAGASTGRGRDVPVFGLALIAGQAVSAATTPLFTRALGPADFGALDVLTVGGTLLAGLLLFGFDQAVVRSYYEDANSGVRRTLVSSGFMFLMLVSVAGCAAVVLFSAPLARTLLHRDGFEPVLLASLIGVPPFVGAAYLAEVLRLSGRAGTYALSSLLRAVVGAAIGAVLVLAAHQGARGALLGLAVGSAVAVVYGATSARRLLTPKMARRPLGKMLRFGLPLVPSAVALWSLMVADRLILVRHVSLGEVGVYALAAKIATLLLWAVNGFRAGWTASLVELHAADPGEAARRRPQALLDAVAIAVGLAALLGGLAAELTSLGGGRGFGGATRVVPVLLIALLFFSTTSVTQSAMLLHYRTGVIARHTGGGAVVNLVACLLLIPTWGIQGAAIATVAGFAYMAVAFYRSAQRIDRVDYRPARTAVVVALVVPYLVLGQVTLGPLPVSVALKLACLSALPPMLRRAGVGCPRARDALAVVAGHWAVRSARKPAANTSTASV